MAVTLIRAVILYLIVIVGLRMMGKRQIGDMQPAELVVTIMISELAAIPMQDLNRPLANGIIAIVALVVTELIVSFILIKSSSLRRIMSGTSAVLVRAGQMDQKLMKALRVSVEDLMEDFRQQGIFDLAEVDYAVLETNGKLSVLKKVERQTVTLQDMNIQKQAAGIPYILVADGKFVEQGLELTGYTEERVRKLLKKEKMPLEEVFLLISDNSGQRTLVRRDQVL